MQRFGALVLAVLLSTLGFAGCGKGQQGKKLVDGVYRAEFKDYDSYGYRDYVQVTVEDGTVVKVEYDGTNTEGNLKTKDEKYQKDMEKTQDTNPTRYTSDLTNQLMEKGSIDQVDDVAGALDRVLSSGGGQIGELVQKTYADGRTICVVYATDPEGNILELQGWS